MSRELDALVAEKVMGWQDARAFFPWPESGVMLDNYAMMPPYGGAIRDIAHVPCYSTDIAAAWEVVEKLDGGGERKTFWWTITSPGDDTMYSARIVEGSVEIAYAIAPAAPEAICLAALKVVK